MSSSVAFSSQPAPGDLLPDETTDVDEDQVDDVEDEQDKVDKEYLGRWNTYLRASGLQLKPKPAGFIDPEDICRVRFNMFYAKSTDWNGTVLLGTYAKSSEQRALLSRVEVAVGAHAQRWRTRLEAVHRVLCAA